MTTPALTRTSPSWGQAGVWSLGFVAVLWVAEIVDTLLGNRLDAEGIRPGYSDGLSGIAFAPLLHAGFGHLIANSVPLLVLGFLILLSGVARWAAVTTLVWVVAGVGTWLFGGVGTVHLGASGLVFGWLTYLIVRGFVTRRPGPDPGRDRGPDGVRRGAVGRAPRPARDLVAGPPLRRARRRARRLVAVRWAPGRAGRPLRRLSVVRRSRRSRSPRRSGAAPDTPAGR